MKIFIVVIVVVIIGAIALLALSPKPSEDLERAQVTDIQEDTVNNTLEENTQEAGEGSENNSETAITSEDVTFAFTGYGPGGSHPGTFNDISVRNVAFGIQEGDTNIVPTSGTIAFQVASVETDSTTLDGHLCRENFFDCENHKEITFDFVSAEKINETDYNITGNLQIKGITKQITIPASYAKGFAQADFVVDMTEFNFSAPTVNPEVEISISAKII
jgi:hypothetical protein